MSSLSSSMMPFSQGISYCFWKGSSFQTLPWITFGRWHSQPYLYPLQYMTSFSLLVSSSTSCQGRAGIFTSLSVGTFSIFQENSDRSLASYPRALWQGVRSWIREIISITINSSYPTLCSPFLSQHPQDLPTIYSLCPDVTCWWDSPRSCSSRSLSSFAAQYFPSHMTLWLDPSLFVWWLGG